jgi:protein-tyrosine-phosphatase
MTLRKILFVCTGNICRSPMAEAIARDIIQKEHGGAIGVFSTGTFALPGLEATREAVEALVEFGIELRGHRATALNPGHVEAAELVLTMTAAHRSYVLELVPGAASKVWVLADYAGRSGDLDDPWGRPLSVYRECASRLRGLVAASLTRFVSEF